MWVCWQFFPSLRVLYASNKEAVSPLISTGNVVSEEPLQEEATTASAEAVKASQFATSEEMPAAEGSVKEDIASS